MGFPFLRKKSKNYTTLVEATGNEGRGEERGEWGMERREGEKREGEKMIREEERGEVSV